MNGYGYSQVPQRPPQGQNPSNMQHQFDNQPVGGMPMPMPMAMPMPITQSTPYPNQPGQPGLYPNLTTPYPAEPSPYTNSSAPYPAQHPSDQSAPRPVYSNLYLNHSNAYPSQTSSYPGQKVSQPPQQSYTSSESHHVPNPTARINKQPPFNPMYGVQPTAPTAFPRSNIANNCAPTTNNHSSVSPVQLATPSACSKSNSMYNSASTTNYHTSSSCQVGESTTNTQIVVKLTPTVLYNPNFNAVNDAQVLRKAMKGFGTDEKTIISILSNRNNEHRQQIAKHFRTLYGKDLIKDLKSELSGRFEDLIIAMMTPIVDYYVKVLHNSMSGIGTNEDILIIILCTLKNEDIQKICAAYKIKYGKSLESDIRDDTSGHFGRLMVSLCTGRRDESTCVDIQSAVNDASRLYCAGVGRLGTNESEFNAILAQRNIHQLKLIFQEYSKLCGHDISTAIESEFSGYIKKALLAIVDCVNNSALYFAKQLMKSMEGIGTDDDKLIFICVTRSEVDMGDIKKAFQQKYGKTLEKRISEDTSGDYKKCLIELIS